ncbi:MAG TPA: M20 family metallopeptidase [Thermoanaerobaculales bacterium]|nr:M20 family metallopeptidase [Thermoanaerobaculales bacterium]
MDTVHYFADRLPRYLEELRALVAIETPTGDVARAERAADLIAALFSGLGTSDREDLAGLGPMLRIRRPGTGSRVLLLAHNDTVWPAGSWEVPWLERDGRIWGPGVYDMKAGLLFLPWLLRWLRDAGRDHPELEILLTPDEEKGSPGSRSRIGEAAARADFALVLEPATPLGHLKLARKGSGEFQVDVAGRTAHQGAAPEEGVNAVVEAAHQVLRMLELQDAAAGTTVGPNIISGGSASNTIADRVRIVVDVRAWTEGERLRLDEGLRALTPVNEGARVEVRGAWNRPPMEPSPAAVELFERARGIGSALGMSLESAAWGGSSDGCLTAAAGAPTLDGLGPVGDEAHTRSENIVVAELPRRMALLGELVASLAVAPEEWLSTGACAFLRSRSRG